MSEHIYPPAVTQTQPTTQTLGLPFVPSTAQVFAPNSKRKPTRK